LDFGFWILDLLPPSAALFFSVTFSVMKRFDLKHLSSSAKPIQNLKSKIQNAKAFPLKF